MPTTTKRETALARLVDTAFLVRVVPQLRPETLHQLIQYRGLDACGELLTAATPAQLNALLDIDLWHSIQPGRDEHFDVDRFGEWLEVLVDAGDSVAAGIVAALAKPLVIAGLARYLRVFDPGTFEPTESSDDESTDRHDKMNSETSRDVLECGLGGYLVRARRTDAWDAIIALLVTLEADHNRDFHALMQGCRRLSNSRPEIDGLDELLTTPEQHLHDVAGEREQRRSRRGYATPADARAFLRMARQSQQSPSEEPRNPLATAYFRAAEEVVALLAEGGVTVEQPRALLEAADSDPRSLRLATLRRMMEFLLHEDEPVYLTRHRELAFLANTLLAGCSLQSRPFTPREASDAAACICNLGLECWGDATIAANRFLVEHDLVAVFEVGWSMLHRDVSLFVTDELISILAGLRCIDADTDRQLQALQRQLAIQRAAGTPWLARDAADVLATLDMTAWISVLGLLDECPIFPATLTAILERRTTSVSPTAFQFISTTAQIGDIRVFMKALRSVLAS